MTHLRIVWSLVLAVVVALGTVSCGAASGAAGEETLDVAAFAERVAAEDTVVLDVRTPAEYASGHVADAINIDVEGGSFVNRLADLDKDATYAVYCRSGNRSAVALQQMKDAGFTDVAHLDGGIGAWQVAGHEVVTD